MTKPFRIFLVALAVGVPAFIGGRFYIKPLVSPDRYSSIVCQSLLSTFRAIGSSPQAALDAQPGYLTYTLTGNTLTTTHSDGSKAIWFFLPPATCVFSPVGGEVIEITKPANNRDMEA